MNTWAIFWIALFSALSVGSICQVIEAWNRRSISEPSVPVSELEELMKRYQQNWDTGEFLICLSARIAKAKEQA